MKGAGELRVRERESNSHILRGKCERKISLECGESSDTPGA